MDNNTTEKRAAIDFDDQLSDSNEKSGFKLDSESIIMVIGVGGAGGNAVNHMQHMDIRGVNFVACNTDKAALRNCKVENKLQLGPGHGAGNNPAVGRQYAIESEEQIRSLLETSGAKMLFIAAGMGGGTGTGASPVIANIAHDLGILTVAVVTMPFRMEGPKRYESAVAGVQELNKWVDSLLVIDNERLRKLYGKLPIREAFGKADDVLGLATKGIAELITVEYALVRVDFADVETVMRGSGRAHMSVGVATGEDRAIKVAENALFSSLLDDNHICGAQEILLSFSVSNIDNLTHESIGETLDFFQKHAQYVDQNNEVRATNIIWGVSEKSWLKEDELELVVVATRFSDGKELKIDTEYHKIDGNIDNDPDPFSNKPKTIDVVNPGTGNSNTPEIHRRRSEGPTIQPPQDKYKLVRQQQVDPAYTRQRTEFMTDSESQTRTQFRPCSRREEVEQVEPESNNNSLFPM